MFSALVLSFILAAGSCTAGVVPTAPGPGQTFKEDSDCTFSWNLDTTGKWTNFSVDLMSGSNSVMQPVINVFKGRDGTKGETKYTWTCPKVTPHSNIYFYQFTQPGADTAWTTRFIIAPPSGEVTAPENSVQPNGASIGWGVGHLAGAGADSTTPPATTTSPSNNTSAPITPTANATNSVNTTSATPATSNTTLATNNTTTGTVNTAPTQSTTSATGSSSKTPPSSSSSSPSGGDKVVPTTSAASFLSNNVAVAFALAAVVVVAC